MHDTAKRLFLAATTARPQDITDWASLARFIGVSEQITTNWKTRGVAKKEIIRLAILFGIDAAWLATGQGDMRLSPSAYMQIGLAGAESHHQEIEDAPMLTDFVRVPVVGEVQGGMDGYLLELEYPTGSGEGWVEHPVKDRNSYALRVRGDSMHPRYRAGEFVIISPNLDPQAGDDVVVICKDGRKMLKQLNWHRDDEMQFLSVNDNYAPITLRLDEIESVMLVSGAARRSAFVKA